MVQRPAAGYDTSVLILPQSFRRFAVKRLLLLVLPAAFLLAAEPADEAKKDLEKLQGEWVMATLEVDGKPVPEEKLRGTTLTIKGDKYITHVKDTKHEVTIKLDPSKKPK